MSKKYTDHLGNEYDSLSGMCEHYGITRFVYRDRKKSGWSLKQILTTPVGQSGRRRNNPDYVWQKELADKNNIPYTLVLQRWKRGVRGKDLVKPSAGNPRTKNVRDHLGNEYPSMRALASAYNLSPDTIRNRLKGGMSIEEALTTSTPTTGKRASAFDHLGNEFKSVNAMCRFYGVEASLFRDRIARGKSLEEALIPVKTAYKPIDYKGHKFNSLAEMFRAYGTNYGSFQKRMDAGSSLKNALISPLEKSNHAFWDFHGFNGKRLSPWDKESILYECECEKCKKVYPTERNKYRFVLTVEGMVDHEKRHLDR